MNIGIIGTGAYAIALSSILENKNINITMWTILEDEYEELTTNHTNLKVINYKLHEKIKFTTNIKKLVAENDLLILAVPAKFVKSTVDSFKEYYKSQDILIATKGVEANSKLLIHDYLNKELKTDKLACISGPSFAKDIIKREPLGLTLASKNQETLSIFKEIFSNISYLTIEPISDISGCELCGALKNIMAIVSGILGGMNETDSTSSKFLVDASKEIQKIIKGVDGVESTFYTYAGLGDLILTCSSTNSRNYTFGSLIGSNGEFETYKKTTTVEGLENLDTIHEMLKERNIKSEIIDILYEIVYFGKPKELILNYLKNNK